MDIFCGERIYVEVSPEEFKTARQGKRIKGLWSSAKRVDIYVRAILGREIQDLSQHRDSTTEYKKFTKCSLEIVFDGKTFKHDYPETIWLLSNPNIYFD